MILRLIGRGSADCGVQLQSVTQFEVDRLVIAVPATRVAHRALPPRLDAVGVVFGKDPQRFRVLADDALPHLSDPGAHLIGRHDPQLAARHFLNEHGSARHVAARLELAGYRHDIAVSYATDLDDLHCPSIYTDLRVVPRGRRSKLAPLWLVLWRFAAAVAAVPNISPRRTRACWW